MNATCWWIGISVGLGGSPVEEGVPVTGASVGVAAKSVHERNMK